MKTLKCQYCGEATVKVQGDVIYKGRPDLKDKNFSGYCTINIHIIYPITVINTIKYERERYSH